MEEYKAYDQETLRRIQKVETAMLKEFNLICEENNIEYFVCYGATLGTVRHKGFIPWDDDIDIFMTRANFDKFNKIVSEEKYSSRYEMLSAANSDDYLMPEAHWQYKGTKFVDKPTMEIKNIEFGIFLDLFILDNLADDPKLAKKQMRKCLILAKLMMIYSTSIPIIPFGGVLGKIVALVIKFVHHFMHFIRINPRKLYNKFTAASTKYNGEKTEYMTNFRVTEMEESKMNNDDIYPLIKMPFEDTYVYVNNKYHEHLVKIYGENYMELPPEDKRHNHRPEILDFGTSLTDFNIE